LQLTRPDRCADRAMTARRERETKAYDEQLRRRPEHAARVSAAAAGTQSRIHVARTRQPLRVSQSSPLSRVSRDANTERLNQQSLWPPLTITRFFASSSEDDLGRSSLVGTPMSPGASWCWRRASAQPISRGEDRRREPRVVLRVRTCRAGTVLPRRKRRGRLQAPAICLEPRGTVFLLCWPMRLAVCRDRPASPPVRTET